jgi:hypothetical protein
VRQVCSHAGGIDDIVEIKLVDEGADFAEQREGLVSHCQQLHPGDRSFLEDPPGQCRRRLQGRLDAVGSEQSEREPGGGAILHTCFHLEACLLSRCLCDRWFEEAERNREIQSR